MDFGFKVTEKDKVTVAHLSGRLMDKSTAHGLIEKVDQLLSSGRNKIIFDMGKLEYMNSSGLNMMVNFLTKSRNAGGDVAIANVSSKIGELLLVTKLNTLFQIHPTVENAEQELIK